MRCYHEMKNRSKATDAYSGAGYVSLQQHPSSLPFYSGLVLLDF